MITEKLTTIARPYAQAAFSFALDNNEIAAWENCLNNAARITQNPLVQRLLKKPENSKKQIEEVYFGILESNLDQEKKNFIRLLIEYDRLAALPEIATLFTQYRSRYEKRISVKIASAIPLDSAHQQKFIDALTRRLKRKVALNCEVDPALIGGAVIQAGDLVIDGSVRGKLDRMLDYI